MKRNSNETVQFMIRDDGMFVKADLLKPKSAISTVSVPEKNTVAYPRESVHGSLRGMWYIFSFFKECSSLL